MLWLVYSCTFGAVYGSWLLRWSNPQVTLKNGTLLGSFNPALHQDEFLGIPYAQPPTNDLRFRRPQLLNISWPDIRPATEYSPSCRGVSMSLPGFMQQVLQFRYSEDCLTLNVVRPSGHTQGPKLPVLFWIHGGGLQDGGSGDPRYNMSFIVDESVKMGSPIIGVSINYRLSGWGFLAGSQMNASGNANLGLHDQRMALLWVQENIGAFGGDPEKVTILGESSGASSVGYRILAHNGQNHGLFRAAIAQSGGVVNPSGPLSIPEQDATYSRVLNMTGCLDSTNSMSCLRSASTDSLDRAFLALSFRPVIDGTLVPDIQSRSLREGRFAKVPLLIGTNRNEGTAMAYTAGRLTSNSTDFLSMIKAFDSVKGLSSSAAQVLLEAYTVSLSSDDVASLLGTVKTTPNETFGSLYGRTSIYLGDFFFAAGKRFSAQIWSQHDVPAYSYRFDIVPNGISADVLGSTHFQEVAFVFGNVAGLGYDINPFSLPSDMESRQLRQQSLYMTRMWISFVDTLSPNNPRSKS
ncbi:hypothetical protein CPLU01_09424 [Colletotrichum plurivorum]|uniref:Carboxylic ester hydrolase n=1 Tax=Colletotrichum plurivorum TaxID=2175906 RepID=A0A8H6K8Q2_9PEZI|nr:hypothetical protein CPLU01_09424 [Colletotrichum plurivorum]